MKNPFILIQLFLFLGLGFSSVICGAGHGESQTVSVSSSYKPEQVTYIINRYVLGSGGVTGAIGTNHIHRATVEIFNVVGQRIRLLSSQLQGSGSMQVVWDGKNEHGEAVGSGIYFYRLTAHSTNAGENNASILFQEIKKMLFVK